MGDSTIPPNASWECFPDMLVPRMYGHAACTENEIYIFGGCNMRGLPLQDAEVYNHDTKQWSKLPELPRKAFGSMMVQVGDRCIFVGGYDDQRTSIRDVVAFNTSSGEYQTLPSLPKDCLMYTALAATPDGDLFVIGGGDIRGSCTGSCMMLEKDAPDWEILPDIPNKRYAAKAIVYNNQVFTFGGRTGRNPVSPVDVLDISSKTWSSIDNSEFPDRRIFSSAVQHGNNVYMVGGLKGTHDFQNSVEVFDLKTKSWTRSEPTPFSRAEVGVGFVKGHIVSTIGMCEYGPNQVTEVFNLENEKWFTLGEMPSPRLSCSTVAFKDNMFVVLGGLGLKGHTTKVETLVFKN